MFCSNTEEVLGVDFLTIIELCKLVGIEYTPADIRYYSKEKVPSEAECQIKFELLHV